MPRSALIADDESRLGMECPPAEGEELGGPEQGLSQEMAAGDQEPEEEGRRPQVLPAPQSVSMQEREVHELTHIPYRSWCRYCVRGRGRNTQHRRQGDEDRRKGTPRVSMDYFFMSTVDQAASENPILVMLEESTGERYARAVGHKGLGQDGERNWLIKDLSDQLKAWGHAGGEGGQLIIKTDGENSIVSIRDALARYHGGRVIPEAPPRGESQSNGAIEEAGKTVREYFRVLKEHVEHKTGFKVTGADVLTPWMIRWAAELYSRYAIGRDGLTPYERRRGRRCAIPVAAFGERVWYKELRQHHERRDKMESEWFEGLWLGHSRNSNEHLVGTSRGVVKAYSIKRRAEDERWNRPFIEETRGTPQQPDPARAGLAIPISVRFDAQVPEDETPDAAAQGETQRQIRRMRITEALLKQHGFTEGCEGCRFRRAGLGETRPHTEVCRSRIEAAMSGDDAGKRALEEQRQRLERRRAEQIEQTKSKVAAETEATSEVPRVNPERAQNTSAGCSNRGARSGEDPAVAQFESTGHDSDVNPAENPSGSGAAMSDGGESPRGVGNAEHSQFVERRGRSRSPKRARAGSTRARERSSSGGSGRSPCVRGPSAPNQGIGQNMDCSESSAVKRQASDNEPEPKRTKQQDLGTDMDVSLDCLRRNRSRNDMPLVDSECSGLQSLRKLITVGPNTQISAEEAPQEETNCSWSMAWDDTTGEELDPKEVAKARSKEMDYVRDRGVWRKVPRSLAVRNGWKIIPTRWIDVNKGDHLEPNYRSRLVAKEFNDGAQEGLFAGTPPLEALRLLLSDAATSTKDNETGQKVIMLNDVARAFFEAPMTRTVCVELPEEARAKGEDDMVGLLKLSLYGTRDAAANFQSEVRRFMQREGFTQSKYNPQIYWHRGRDIKTIVHGDDFISSAQPDDAKWLQERLGGRFEIKTNIIGSREGMAQEHRVLGRILRVTSSGWEMEADPRHAELLIKGLRLDTANGVKSPGEEPRAWVMEENAVPLSSAQSKEYRAMAARANYLAQDRTDIQFAAKECCRGMANPTHGDLKALRRLARYLICVPRVVWQFVFQARPDRIRVYSDSDWAGCRRTARSTSGGVAMLGAHCLRSYSVTQKFVTLSSGEAELMAMVKATTEAIGLTQLAAGWGIDLQASVFVDSTAALAVTNRKGCGKLRHVRIGYLWIQELAEADTVLFAKVRGEVNPADIATKHLVPAKREQLIPLISQVALEGEAKSRLRLAMIARGVDPYSRSIPGILGTVRTCGLGPSSEGECLNTQSLLCARSLTFAQKGPLVSPA